MTSVQEAVEMSDLLFFMADMTNEYAPIEHFLANMPEDAPTRVLLHVLKQAYPIHHHLPSYEVFGERVRVAFEEDVVEVRELLAILLNEGEDGNKVDDPSGHGSSPGDGTTSS